LIDLRFEVTNAHWSSFRLQIIDVIEMNDSKEGLNFLIIDRLASAIMFFGIYGYLCAVCKFCLHYFRCRLININILALILLL
jgi:uncharacterized protein with PQ loop repeat